KNDGGTNAGSYDVVLTLADANYYTWPKVTTAALTLKFTINKVAQAPLSITQQPRSVTYGDAPFTLGTTGGSGDGAVTWEANGAATVDANGKVTINKVAYLEITATKAADGNHTTAVSATYKGTPLKAPLTITANDQTLTYGDAFKSNGVTYKGFVNGDTEATMTGTLGYTTTYTTQSAVGSTQTLTPKGLTNSNYEITFAKGKVTVTPREVTLSWNDTATRVYDNIASKVTATAGNVANGETLTVTVTGGTEKNAGSHTATATGLKGSTAANYKLPEAVTQSYSIVKSVATIAAEADQEDGYTYGDKIQVMAMVLPTGEAATSKLARMAAPTANQIALYYGDTQISEPVTVPVTTNSVLLTYDTADKLLPVGESTLTVKYVGNTDMADASTTVNVTIAPNPVTATVTTPTTKAYDTTNTATVALGVAAKDLIDAKDAVTVTAPATYSDANVGTGKAITFDASKLATDGAQSSYYKVSLPTDVTGEITAKAVTAALTLETDSYEYDGTAKTPAVTAAKDGEVTIPATEYTVEYTDNTAAGTATVAVKDAENGNYTVAGTTTFAITKKPLAVVVTAADKVYDGKADATVAATVDTGVAADTLTITGVLGTFPDANAGKDLVVSIDSGSAVVTGEAKDNYTLTYPETAKAAITPKPITVTAEKQTKLYGSKDAPLTYTAPGVVKGDTLVGTLERAPGEDVKEGGYAITEGSLLTKNNPNYEITFVPAVLTIDKVPQAALAITGQPKTLTYGDAPFTLAAPGGSGTGALTWAVAGPATVDENGKVTVTGAGEITITATKAADGNHTLPVTASSTLTAAQKPLTWDLSDLKVDTQKHADGNDAASFTGSLKVAGAVEGDTLGFAYKELSVRYAAATAGQHTITVTPVELVLANANYSLPTAAITYQGTIAPADPGMAQPSLPTVPGQSYRLVVESGISLVPATLATTTFNTPAAITAEMLRVTTTNTGYTADHVTVSDVVLQVSADNGTSWADATAENFPAGGITVLLPYPAGTGPDTHDFIVTHMITTGANGHTPGSVEMPAVTKTAQGLQVTLTGLSPVSIGWKSKGATATDNGTTSGTNGANSTSGTSGTNGSGTAPQTVTLYIPQTGDAFPMGALALVLLCSALGMGGFAYVSHKKRNK
ncbi:MAG: MBG domain-containing protein, partial [Gemmiger sp.]|nr:MBG domain-containing protein [Gemmiger sp.]